MERINPRRVVVRNAWWAASASLVCVVVYVLGCVLSKPAWSPDSSRVALLVTPPGDDPHLYAVFTYDIRKGAHRLLDELQANGILSGPAWSPDGKWIAYYRVEPSAEPNAPASAAADPNSGAAATAGAHPVARQANEEGSAVLPGLLLDLVKGRVEDKAERFDVKVMVVTPDGKDKRALCTTQWVGRRDDLARLMVMSPVWSIDSRHVFYAHTLGEVFSMAEVDLVTGHTRALCLSSTGSCTPSPDGQWVATLLADESKQVALVLAKADGRMQKYVKLDFDLGDKDDLGLSAEVSWSPDSARLLVSMNQKMLLVSAATGEGRLYRDPQIDDTAFGVLSPEGQTIYYIAGLKKGDPNSPDQDVDLKSLTLANGQTKRLVRLSEGLAVKSAGRFSISPNGKAVLFRCTRKDQTGTERAALVLWDGKRSKTIETDPWLEALPGSKQVGGGR